MLTSAIIKDIEFKFNQKKISIAEFLNFFLNEQEELSKMIEDKISDKEISNQISGLRHLMAVYVLEVMSSEQINFKS